MNIKILYFVNNLYSYIHEFYLYKYVNLMQILNNNTYICNAQMHLQAEI